MSTETDETEDESEGHGEGCCCDERQGARRGQEKGEEDAAREPRGEVGEEPTAVLEDGVHGVSS